MAQQSLEVKEKKSPGRPPLPKVDIQGLEDRIKRLEECLSKVATLTGQGNYLKEFGLTRWVPTKEDMKKYKG